jgi:hypothetical protein
VNLEQYQPLARRTLKELPLAAHIEHMAIGVTGELGEIADAVKKHVIYGKPLDLVNLAEEGGDCWWYIVGLQPETRAGIAIMERCFNDGVRAVKDNPDYLGMSDIRLVVRVQRNVALNLDSLMVFGGDTRDSGPHYVNALCFEMGVLYGRFGLDLSASLTANVNKLAKRYGDKYSDYAALNRDTAAERNGLEADLQVRSA